MNDSCLIYPDSTINWLSMTLFMSLSFFKQFTEKSFARTDEMQEVVYFHLGFLPGSNTNLWQFLTCHLISFSYKSAGIIMPNLQKRKLSTKDFNGFS